MLIDHYPRLVVLLIVSLLPARVGAQDALTLELKGTADKFTIGEPPVLIPIPSGVGSKITIKVQCASPFDCTKVAWSGAAMRRLQKQPGTTATATEAVFLLPGGPADASFSLKLSHDNKPSDNAIDFKSASGGGDDDPDFGNMVAEALTTACQTPNVNEETLVLNVFGQPLTVIPKSINTETRIKTRVLVDARIAHLINVHEGSEFATPVITNIYGKGEGPFADKSTGTKRPAHACVLTPPVSLGPFASPKGTIEIAVYNGDVKVVGTRSFRVAPLYTGMFTLGGISTRVAAPTFEKAYNGTDTLVSARETGPRILYTAMYSQFLRKRDLSEPPSDFLDVVSPMVGVVINDVPNNVLYGVNFQIWYGLSVVAGWHTGKVSEIDPASGAVDGKPYANRSATIPTRNTWKTDRFWGISVDALAASGLLKSIFSK